MNIGSKLGLGELLSILAGRLFELISFNDKTRCNGSTECEGPTLMSVHP